MSAKEAVLEAVRALPDSVSLAEIRDRIAMLEAIERGLDDARSGRVIPHAEMEKQMQEWLAR